LLVPLTLPDLYGGRLFLLGLYSVGGFPDFIRLTGDNFCGDNFCGDNFCGDNFLIVLTNL
jgi:hypothetical protein